MSTKLNWHEEKKIEYSKKKHDKQTQTEKELPNDCNIQNDKGTNTCCEMIKLQKEHKKAIETIKEKNIEIDLLKNQIDLMEWKIDDDDILNFEIATDILNIDELSA